MSPELYPIDRTTSRLVVTQSFYFQEIDDDEEKKHPAFDIVGFNEGKWDGTFKRIEENNSVSGKDNRSFSMGEIAKH